MNRSAAIPVFFSLLLASLPSACRAPQADESELELGQGTEARALDGRPLARPDSDPEQRATLESDLAEAERAWRAAPDDETALVWYGRRLAYLGRFRDAVRVYDDGLRLHPQSYRLLRHRGHRLLTLRLVDRAISDLQRASKLIRGVPDEVELDGAPNAAGVPRSTNHFNIEYHLGLAHFVRGDYPAALAAWERAAVWARVNDDLQCAAGYWTYLTLRELGRDDEARALLVSFDRELEILENDAYRDLLAFYRGDAKLAEVLEGVEPDTVEFGTRAFGLAQWLSLEGEVSAARGLYRRVVATSPWPAFGHLAAEAELARSRSKGDPDTE